MGCLSSFGPDASLYTGAHRERFDESGRGRGKDGRTMTFKVLCSRPSKARSATVSQRSSLPFHIVGCRGGWGDSGGQGEENCDVPPSPCHASLSCCVSDIFWARAHPKRCAARACAHLATAFPRYVRSLDRLATCHKLRAQTSAAARPSSPHTSCAQPAPAPWGCLHGSVPNALLSSRVAAAVHGLA